MRPPGVARLAGGLLAAAALPVILSLGACSGESAGPANATPTPGDAMARPPEEPARQSRAKGADDDARGRPPVPDDLVRSDDTLDTLRARHGRGNVVAATLAGAEGDRLPGWVLFPADPGRRIEVHLDEAGRPFLLNVARGTLWRRGDGVAPGMDSRELEAINGRPFGLMGFGWDYGGVVTDWRGGRLGSDGVGAGPVRLCAPSPPAGELRDDYPIGDAEFGSDHPAIRATPAIVCEVGLRLDAPREARTR